MNQYVYMHESSIDDDLKCGICKKPFVNPFVLPPPCEETFCLNCIQKNLENHSNTCPQCNRKTLSKEDLKRESRTVQKMLDRLQVKCLLCSGTNIPRGHFFNHQRQFCPKRIVLCHANDVKCPWNGPYDQLNQHFHKCPYEQIRPVLHQLIQDNQRLQELDQLKIDLKN